MGGGEVRLGCCFLPPPPSLYKFKIRERGGGVFVCFFYYFRFCLVILGTGQGIDPPGVRLGEIIALFIFNFIEDM